MFALGRRLSPITVQRELLRRITSPFSAVKCPMSSGTNDAESVLKELLSKRFPRATNIRVEDISGGCGSMYEIHVEAPDFASMRRVKQHKLVTECLKEQIKDMHGLRIDTTVSKTS